MSVTKVTTGFNSYKDVSQVAINCPFCNSYITPDYLFFHEGSVFARCTNSYCGKHFILGYGFDGNFTSVQQNASTDSRSFSKIINDISSSFQEIYNQAYCAEQLNLVHICGVGYRKALEFLIKDFLISETEDEVLKEGIKKKLLGNCINENVQNEKIKAVAKRAAWLGNDETHYLRRWEGKDVNDLKRLIDLTIHWIESEVETRQLLEDMPEQ